MIRYMSAEAGKAIFDNFETLQLMTSPPWQPNPLEVKTVATEVEGDNGIATKQQKTSSTLHSYTKTANKTHHTHVQQANQALLYDKAQMQNKLISMQQRLDGTTKPKTKANNGKEGIRRIHSRHT
jgi:hypothetical protein